MASPLYYQSSLISQEVQQREHLLHLYLYQIYSGPASGHNQKDIVVTSHPNGFGSTTAIDWAVYDGILPNGNLVARAQGIAVRSALDQPKSWFASFNLVFTNGRFKGSGLKVDATLEFESGGELAIVGGTGEFAGAQGTIASTYTRISEKVLRELDLRFVCPASTELTPVTPPIKVLPPVGGNGGQDVDVAAKPRRLESVTIRSGDVVDSISFSYTDEAGNKQAAGPWGGNGGLPVSINLKPNEIVKKIMGTTGNFGGNVVVNSLKIVTNLDTYGPYGKENGTRFAIPENDNNNVVGFHGRAGLFLDAIGIYTTA